MRQSTHRKVPLGTAHPKVPSDHKHLAGKSSSPIRQPAQEDLHFLSINTLPWDTVRDSSYCSGPISMFTRSNVCVGSDCSEQVADWLHMCTRCWLSRSAHVQQSAYTVSYTEHGRARRGGISFWTLGEGCLILLGVVFVYKVDYVLLYCITSWLLYLYVDLEGKAELWRHTRHTSFYSTQFWGRGFQRL